VGIGGASCGDLQQERWGQQLGKEGVILFHLTENQNSFIIVEKSLALAEGFFSAFVFQV
jgi:hypothetical protein